MNAEIPALNRRRRDELVRRAMAAGSVAEVFAAASHRLRDLVPHDASAWLTTDPTTGFPTAPSRVEGITVTAEMCTEHWHHEFAHDDVNRFRELTRAATPASALRAASADPRRSPRFRRFLQPRGFIDELRAVLRVGDTPWATVTLWRGEGAAPFSPDEVGLVAGLAAPLGESLRMRARPAIDTLPAAAQERPGLLIFDERGHLTSVNEHAPAWLADFPADDKVPTRLGLHVPIWLLLTALHARQSLQAQGDGTARTRIRTSHGRWLVCHASTTRAGDGSPAFTAVVIEPASPALVAPITVAAYGLTEREQEVTRHIARGAGTDEMARALYLSPHTVKDHIKAILRKVGVSTRGELVAMLYADHFAQAHLDDAAPDASGD